MSIAFTTRHLYPDELRILKTLKAKKEKAGAGKIKLYYFLIAAIAGAGCTYLASLVKDSFWVLPFATIAVFAFVFIVFGPYEMYKLRKKHANLLQQLGSLIDKGTVNTCLINAKRIAVAEEYEDEGDLYIIEYDTAKVLYLWDSEYNLQRRFPCLRFEIYEESFFKLFGRQVYARSGRIDALKIDKKAKWNYLGKLGAPGHLQTENVSFDQLIEEYNNCVK